MRLHPMLPFSPVINFNDTVTGSATPFILWWDIGGIGKSVLEDPGQVTSLNAGTYSVSFRVADSICYNAFDSVIVSVAAAG